MVHSLKRYTALLNQIKATLEIRNFGETAQRLVNDMFDTRRLQGLDKKLSAARSASSEPPLALTLYPTTGFEFHMMGYLCNTCAVRVLDPRVERPNMFFVPFANHDASTSEPIFLGGFGVIAVRASEPDGAKCLIIRGVNPTRLLTERVSGEALVDMVIEEADRLKEALGFQFVLIPQCSDANYDTLTNDEDIWRIFRDRYLKTSAPQRLRLEHPESAYFNRYPIENPCVIVPSLREPH
jgi:hypothetical protein